MILIAGKWKLSGDGESLIWSSMERLIFALTGSTGQPYTRFK